MEELTGIDVVDFLIHKHQKQILSSKNKWCVLKNGLTLEQALTDVYTKPKYDLDEEYLYRYISRSFVPRVNIHRYFNDKNKFQEMRNEVVMILDYFMTLNIYDELCANKGKLIFIKPPSFFSRHYAFIYDKNGEKIEDWYQVDDPFIKAFMDNISNFSIKDMSMKTIDFLLPQ